MHSRTGENNVVRWKGEATNFVQVPKLERVMTGSSECPVPVKGAESLRGILSLGPR